MRVLELEEFLRPIPNLRANRYLHNKSEVVSCRSKWRRMRNPGGWTPTRGVGTGKPPWSFRNWKRHGSSPPRLPAPMFWVVPALAAHGQPVVPTTRPSEKIQRPCLFPPLLFYLATGLSLEAEETAVNWNQTTSIGAGVPEVNTRHPR